MAHTQVHALPSPGSVWQHRNGARYVVRMLANTASTKNSYPVTVVYENAENGTVWSRPAYDWHRSMSKVA